MLFNNIKGLIDYCKLCEICGGARELQFTVGPDDPGHSDTDLIRLKDFKFEENFLTLDVSVKILESKYKIIFKINALDNTFTATIPQAEVLDMYERASTRATRPEMYFSIYSACPNNHASSQSLDMNFNLLKKRITPEIGMSEEMRLLVLDDNSMFCVEYFYNEDKILLSKCKVEDENFPVKWGKEVALPMTTFDFSNKEKLTSKLKTLMLFS